MQETIFKWIREFKKKKKKANISTSVVRIDWIIRGKINKQQTFYYAFYNNVYILSSIFVFPWKDVFIKISHCSSSENCSLAHIWKPSRWLWWLAVFLSVWNASPEPGVNPLCRTGADGVCRGGGEEEGEKVPKDLPTLHRWDPERCRPSPWSVSRAGQWERVAAAPLDVGDGWQPPCHPSALIPAEPPGTGLVGPPLTPSSCALA